MILADVIGDDSAMMQDEQMFPEPDAFRPERFLDTDNPRLQNFTLHFGFGRRICPGMYIANQAIFVVLARYAPFCAARRGDSLNTCRRHCQTLA